jgi:hypothetical protein
VSVVAQGDSAVRIEFPADPWFVSVVRAAVGSSAEVYGERSDAGELSAAVGEALVVVGVDAGRAGMCDVRLELEPGGARATVTGPGLDVDAEEGEMARLVLTGLSDEFSESAGTDEATVTLTKAFAAT